MCFQFIEVNFTGIKLSWSILHFIRKAFMNVAQTASSLEIAN